jgi:hypothetical protein
LTDPLLAGLSILVSSDTLDKLDFLWPEFLGGGAIPVGPKLDPRPVASFSGGDATRNGGASKLAARLCDFAGIGGCIFCGIAGTGGASTALGTVCEARFGEGSRKDLSDIEPLLPLRSSCGRADAELPIEDVEPALFIVLFVCKSATEVGVVGRDRKAAPAAADAREALEARFFRKAWAAAVVADAFALDPLRDYRVTC